jgi:hypothetical protein
VFFDDLLTPWSKVFPEQLREVQLVKSIAFRGSESSLLCSQDPATGFCSEADESSPQTTQLS